MFLPTRILMRLMLMMFVRTSELIETPWSEIGFENESCQEQVQKWSKNVHKPATLAVRSRVFCSPKVFSVH